MPNTMKKLSFMSIILVSALALTFSGCGNRSGNKQVREIAVEDFFKNPEKVQYRISPDGKYISYLAPWEKRLNIFVQEFGKTEARRITSEKDRDLGGYFWASNNRLLFLKDVGGDENFQLFGVNADGSNLKGLTNFPKVRTQVIDALDDIDDEVIIGMNKRDPQVFDAYRLNIVSGELTMLAENPGNIQGWMTDHDGKLRVAIATDGVNQSLLFREKEEDPFKVIITTNFKESLEPQFFTFDNKRLFCLSNIGRDKSAVVEFDPATGKEVKVLYQNNDYDVSGLNFSRKRKVLTTAIFESWKTERNFFDKDIEAMFKAIREKLPNYEIGISGMNKDENKCIVTAWGDRTMGTYYTYDKESGKLDKLADIAPWIKEEEMAEMKAISFQSRDGLKINGYLTLPLGKEAKNLPMVLLVHGGPWARDSWGFDPEAQFLANRGYAVLQLNYRGSTGYGRKFWEASFKQWGKTMQDDLTDGVNWMVSQGIADKSRVCIYGGSYGGYATLAGLTFTPDVYACGVDYVGVSNLFTFMKTIPPYWKPYLDMFHEMVGDPAKDSLLMASVSPALNADKIKVPLFVAQGANDPRVNKAESDQMVEALRKRGVQVEYLVKDNEGHGFHNEENRMEFYKAMIAFINKNIGDKKK